MKPLPKSQRWVPAGGMHSDRIRHPGVQDEDTDLPQLPWGCHGLELQQQH